MTELGVVGKPVPRLTQLEVCRQLNAILDAKENGNGKPKRKVKA